MGGGRRLGGRSVAVAAGLLLVSAMAGCGHSPTVAPGPADGTWEATAAAPCAGPGPGQCMLPFPNDYYTTPDRAMANGIRIDFPAGALTAATGGSFDPTDWERNDGFSPGSTVLAQVPGIDLARSAVAGQSAMGASLAGDAPVVLYNATTGTRWPYWAELDANDPVPAEQLLLIHPALNLTEGDRYVVVLRNLRTAAGALIAPPSGAGSEPAAYRAHLASVLAGLSGLGITGKGLYLAWDFHVASAANLTGPALNMRNQTFAALGNRVPPYTVTSVDDAPGSPLLRVVRGTVEVPNYLSEPGGPPGSTLAYGADGRPVSSGLLQAAFECEIPQAAATAPARIGIYGHGLFNDASEVTESSVPAFSEQADYVFCGVDWLGLSTDDVAYAAGAVADLTRFPSIADRLTQSLLDAQVMGRLLDSRAGLAANPAFRGPSGRSLIDPSTGLVYYGNSEGGIMGGALTALSTDIHRSVLGVPGMDYDVLLDRSSDFAPFLNLLNGSYTKAVQQFGFDLLQMLWDRGEADGYAQQMTVHPLPGTPKHLVLLAEGFGDHQVANIQTETEARTIGAGVHQPALAPGRSLQTQPLWGLSPLPAGSTTGSALYVWDSGVPAPPLADLPPTVGPDPHDTVPRSLPAFWAQMATFLDTGRIPDPCGTGPCTAPTPAS